MTLKEKIENLRSELYTIIASDKSETSEILEKSQELDSFIVEYQKFYKQ